MFFFPCCGCVLHFLGQPHLSRLSGGNMQLGEVLLYAVQCGGVYTCCQLKCIFCRTWPRKCLVELKKKTKNRTSLLGGRVCIKLGLISSRPRF